MCPQQITWRLAFCLGLGLQKTAFLWDLFLVICVNIMYNVIINIMSLLESLFAWLASPDKWILSWMNHSTIMETLACYGSKAGENRALFDILTVLTSPIGPEVDSHFNLEHFGTYSSNSLGEQEQKGGFEKKYGGRFIVRHHQSQRMGKEGARHNHLGSSCSNTIQIPTRREGKPRSSVPMLISLHTVWWRHPHSSPSFFFLFQPCL